MKIAYVTIYEARDVSQWSGTPYHMTKAFERAEMQVDYIGPLTTTLPPYFRIKKLWNRIAFAERESAHLNITAAKNYSRQVAKKLEALNPQAIIVPQVNPVAYLDCKQPIVLWTDALYAGLLGFYPPSSNLSATSVKQGNLLTSECLSRSSLAIFSSDWAARSAVELYGVNKEKVKVVPFGANIDCRHTINDIQNMLKLRSPKTLKLLFIGKQWDIKGGDIVFRIAKALHASGQPLELHFVGCHPPAPYNKNLPDYIKCYGFISKRSKEGIAIITQLLRESHFIIAPSRADCCPMVLAEGNAFGLPSLTTTVGGISTAVKNNLNGMTFAHESSVDAYCHYISHLMQHYSEYEELALSSFNEYEKRLNWQVATQQVKKLIQEIL